MTGSREPKAEVEQNPRERVVGLPCDGCELALEGTPQTLFSIARIAPADAAGVPLEIVGVVRGLSGAPMEGVVVYAYQTNSKGVYPGSSPANRHGRFRGWVVSDPKGRFTFRTIRPGSYPVASAPPQHVHFHVVEPGRCTYYIASVEFTDDPLFRSSSSLARGGSGVTTPQTTDEGVRVRRDIALGAHIPDYISCGRP